MGQASPVELYTCQSANFCAEVDWPDGHTHHQ